MPTKKKNRQRRVGTYLRSRATRKPPAFVTPMAAQVVKKLPEGDEWIYELKFDGWSANHLTRMSLPIEAKALSVLR
jgi:ATP-dependent DNA ligase